jgi:uncharacterized protein YjbI with pentapeptide repeats
VPVRVHAVDRGPKLVADPEHLALIRQGVEVWNAWRDKTPPVFPLSNESGGGWNVRVRRWHARKIEPADLSAADLSREHLYEANLTEADLSGANLHDARLFQADLRAAILTGADLGNAHLHKANLSRAKLTGADLSWADLSGANLSGANLSRANLSGANLSGANLYGADLSGANLTGAHLAGANLTEANLAGTNLNGANLSRAQLVETNLTDAVLTGCRVYGASAWDVKLSKDTKQQGLIITDDKEPDVTTDDLEVAQFIYLMLHNEKLQRVIDTITSKVVLILGRFSPERKIVLDALRDELRNRNYAPVVFDFEKPRSGTTINTVTLLARMALFVIADISDAKSVLMELLAIVPTSPRLPVQPIIVAGQELPGMFDTFEAYPWFLKVHPYESPAQLLVDLKDRVIGPLEAEVAKLR